MSEKRALWLMAVALSFFAGIAIGVIGGLTACGSSQSPSATVGRALDAASFGPVDVPQWPGPDADSQTAAHR
ncbi:MAG TPA: hypothetical protein VFY29_06720 [Terriglobia bacterium]|nr:hypothetical protein [Terriglobia bacterium]